ncbi:MAG: SdrD B-like domain-containing protein, partial [Methanothrix sp.]|nr:SdrD B-like domain-containing protein [Methanothrix sp.]
MGNLPSQFQVSSLPGSTISPDPDHPTDPSKFLITIGDVASGATGDAQFKLMMKSDGSACDATGGVLTMEPDYTDDCGNPWAPPLGLISFSVDSSKKPTLTLTKTPTSSGSNILKPNDASTEASFDLQVEFNSNGGGCTATLPVDIVDTYPEGFAVKDGAGGIVDATLRTITWPSTDAAQTLSDGVVWKKTIKLVPQSSACDMCTGTYSTLLSAGPPAGVDCCGCTLSGNASADIIVNGPTLTVSKTAPGIANDYLILSDLSRIATFDLTVGYEKNDGCSDTLDAEIVDAYPAGFTVVDAAGGTVNTNDNTITWSQTGGNALVSGSLWTKTVKIQPPAGSCGESFANTLTATEVNSGPVCPLLSDSKSVKIMVNCIGGTGSVFTTEKSSTSEDACSDIGYTTTYTFQSAVTDWTGYKFGVHFTGPQEFPIGGAPATFAVYDANDSQLGSTKSNYLSPETVSGVPEQELGPAGLDLPPLPKNGKLVVTYTLHTTGPGEIIDWSDIMVSGGQTYHQGLPVNIAPSGPPSFSVKLNIPSVIETCGEFDASIVVTQDDDYYANGLMRVTLDTANYEYVAGSASISGFNGTGLAASAEPDLSTGNPIWNLGDKVRTTSGKGTISFKIKKACGTGPAARALLDYRDKCGGTYQKVGSDEKPVLVGEARLILALTPETIYANQDTQTWRIYVTNTGTGAAHNTIVTDTVGNNLQYVPGTAKINEVASEPLNPSSSILQWRFNSIDIKKTNIIEFQTRLTGCEPGPNTAVAQWGCDYDNPCSTTSTSTSRVVLNTNYQFAVQLVTAPIDPCGDRSGPFSLTITNSGGVHAYGVTATQTLPIGLGIVDGITDGITYSGSHQPLLGFDPDTGKLSLDFTGQDWAPGEYCQISYYLKSDTTPPCKFDPTAASTSARVDYHTPCGSSKAEASNPISLSSSNSQVELTKVQIHPSSSIVDKDEEVSWKITVKNPSGNLWTARNVVVKDLLPSNTQFVAVPITPGYEPTTTPYSGDGTNGNELTWNLGDIAVGSEKSIIVNAIVTICDSGKNTATITWGCCGDTKHTSASIPINVDLKTKPTFSITQASNVNVCSGTISLTVSNSGATAKGPFTLSDTIPVGFVYNGISSAKINGNTVTMPEPTSNGASPATLTWDLTGLFTDSKMLKDDALAVTFKIRDDGSHCSSPAANPQNSATFSGYDLCSNLIMRTVSAPVTVLAPNLVVTKTPHDQKAVVNAKNSWTLTVTNTGTAAAENVVVADTFGSAYQISDAASDVPGGNIQPGGTGTVVTWDLPALAGNGGSWTKVVSATLTSTSSDMNNYVRAEGTCSSGCVYGSDDDTAAATYVTVTKSADASTLTIGDKVDFTITATLLGTGVPFTNVKIKDTLPKGLDVVGSDYYSCSDPASCSGITVTLEPSGENQLITWSLPDFAGAKTVQITLHAVVKDKVNGVSYNKDGNTLVNKVDLVRTVYGQTSTDSDDASVSLVEPRLKLEKAVDNTVNNPITHNPMYHPGDTVTYTITLYHDADSHSAAYQVDVQDTLPTGITYVPGSINIIQGPAGTADDASANSKLLKWHFDQVEQTWVSGNPIRLSYQAKINDDVQTGILNNRVIADYYTKLSPIDNPERRMEPELSASKTINAAVACIGDKVWEDMNGNGRQDSGELGIAGVTVTLFKSDGTQVGTTFTTLADGAYSFSHLEPGDYYLRLSPPPSSSYVFTPKGISGADTDSNAENAASATYGQTDTRTLSIGETISCDSTVDAGLYIPTCLNGLAWVDTNGNGIRDSGESGLEGVSVTLYRMDDFGGADVQKAAKSTDSNGAYSFSDLPPGTYYVVFAKPANTKYLFIIKSAGSETQVMNPEGKTSTITLTSGQACNGTLKAGLYLPASLGDLVWHDKNADGIQDTDDTGIFGAVVTLNKPDGSTSTAITDANGKYLFTGLVPGSYSVVFTKPNGYNSFSPKGIGDADKNSDADTTTGQTTSITLLSGQDDMTWDAGVYKYASLGDFVWHDRNANGFQDTGDTGISGATVKLYKPDGSTSTAITGTGGTYQFTGLIPGSYYLVFTKPNGFDSFSPMDQLSNNLKDSDADTTTGQTVSITLQSGDNDLSWDAGFYKYASLGDFVWHDKNGNGVQDTGEEGIEGVTVALYKSGVASGTMTTGTGGIYKFSGLVPGSYYVIFTRPTGYDSFSPKDKGNNNYDSDADIATGQTASTTLQSGANDITWDAGFYKYTCLNGLAWVDTNGNGRKDGSESGLQGVSVTLYRKDDFGGADVLKATATTDANGAYSFSNLQPGTYYVKLAKPSGTEYLFIIKSAGSETQVLDSSGKTSTVVLTSGQACDGTLKVGLYLPASLGDRFWHDRNANGIQDSGEEGIAGANVILHKPDGSTSTATTIADGKYQFTGLVPGVYSVKFEKPAGYDSFSPKGIGDADKDNDANATGQTADITLISGQNDLTWDAGVYQYASLGDFVWHDMNANGIQETGEAGVAGVIVTLHRPDGSTIDTTTATDGSYKFTGLVPGSYFVTFNKPTDYYSFSPSGQGSDNAADSDADVADGKTASIALQSGESNLKLDAGIYKLASLGDFVWHDKNANGVQDSGEEGIGGVTVKLYRSGALAGSTITDASGYYQFTGLVPGSYSVEFDEPAEYNSFSPRGQGADNAADSDADVADGKTASTTLQSGVNDLKWDAGLYKFTCLSGLAWVDTNGNGIKDSGESGLQDVSVTLYRKDDFSASYVQKDVKLTDLSGAYSFTNLQPGTYYVKFDKPSGTDYQFIYESTGSDTKVTNMNGQTDPVTLTSGQPSCDGTLKAGLYHPASLGDRVWLDKNANGIQDAGETGMEGVPVTLYKSGAFVESISTGSGGFYKFTGLVPGVYSVKFDKPAGYDSFSPKGIGDVDKDSDADAATGQTADITLASGQEDLTWDAGVYQYASLGDFVWHDKNANGIQEAGETGVAGVAVALLRPDGSTIGTTTGPDGSYKFTGLVPGVYSVKFEKPAGYDSFSPKGIGDVDKDSDADAATGQTADITLVSGQYDPTWDVGVYKYASLGDFVWHDKNANGIQDASEIGIEGVTVRLYKSGAFAGSTITDANGEYLFSSLVPGIYSVGFTKPAEYSSFSPADQGGDDGKNSDADTADGQTAPITLQSGDSDLKWDAGLCKDACLGGLAWVDSNGNGIKDGNESGLQDVSVTLYRKDDFGGADVQKGVTSTESSGAYSFSDLQPGTYYVVFAKPTGTDYLFIFESTGSDTKVQDASGQTSTVALTSGQPCDDTLKAGLYLPASLGDFVWHDENANGIQDSGEKGIGGVTVRLYKSGAVVDTTTTHTDGKYQFNNLAPGSYSVEFDKPTGYDSFSPMDQGGDNAVNSDANIADGKTDSTTLQSGSVDNSRDAGLYRNTCLSGLAWVDSNGNGIMDGSENGLQDVSVTPYRKDEFGGTDVLKATAKTDANGAYSFNSLQPGTYYVVFSKPTGTDYLFIFESTGSDTKVTNSNGQTDPVTLASGQQCDGTLKAGLYLPASLGDRFWHDRNANGIQDSGEEGIAGANVILHKPDGSTSTATTIADGKYQFTGLVPGVYSVKFEKPAGYDSFSPKGIGDADKDNDANATGQTADITLISGQNDLTWDAGVYQYASLGDFVWHDMNANGIQETGEAGVEGVIVTLHRPDGSTIDTTTATDGSYKFTGLVPGSYFVTFNKPTDYYSFSPSGQGSDNAADSDADVADGKTASIALQSGESNLKL